MIRSLPLWLAVPLLASCVVGGDAANCNEITCDGCCTTSGNCMKGDEGSNCGSNGQACDTCPYPNVCAYKSGTYGCTRCGDNACNGAETCSSCPSDCGNCCGNGSCGNGETCATCPQDCGVCCGNGSCGNGETCTTCPSDCGVCTSGAAYDRCTFTSQCLSGRQCITSQGGTSPRCRSSCSSSTTCTSVSGYPNDTPYCSTGNYCYLSCPSVGAPCPFGAQCKLRSDNTCCACL